MEEDGGRRGADPFDKVREVIRNCLLIELEKTFFYDKFGFLFLSLAH